LQDVLNIDGESLPLVVKNEIPALVPRFTAIAMSNIVIKPSPVWLQTYLYRTGVRPINNVVDLTNFFMLETGQPSHAYDYAKVKALDGADAATIVVRNPRANEKLTLLNGKTIDPRDEAIVIASEKQLIGLGGVMGGAETEVDENTKNIILEVASFDMYSIRRTSMAHGLFTDAVTRFNKGQSPLQNTAVIAKLVEEMRHWADGKVSSELVDVNALTGREWVHPPVPVTAEFINARLGFTLSADDMKKLLENVEFQVAVESDQLTVTAPFWRTDIETREDVVEEVGRLYGFDHLPQVLPQRSVTPTHRDEVLSTKAMVREKLTRAGANEVLTYSFVHSNLFQKVGQDASLAFSLSNALSPDLQHYRLSLTPSLLEKVHPNVKAGYDEFALFEIGTVHGQGEVDEEGLPKGLGRVGFVCANSKSKVVAPYYRARRFTTELLEGYADASELRFVPVAKAEADFAKHKLFQQMLAPYDGGRAAVVFNGEQPVGVVGEYKPGVMRALKLPADCAGFELFLSAFSKPLGAQYQPLSRFPKVMQDITLKVSADVAFADVAKSIREAVETAKPEHAVLNLSPLGIYQAPDDTEHKNLSFRLEIASYEKTMTDAEVAKLLDIAADATNKAVGAERI
jgi:phenylalanyl-tRNA synthetase beta chain